MILRVKFRKYGVIRYIGHLDVMRFFQKCNRRAELDVEYSKGFSPHQIMSFASPLSVGRESDGEDVDISVNSITSCEDIKRRLNAASVEGIEIVSVKILPDNAGNAMSSVAAAKYEIRIKENSGLSLPDEESWNAFINQDTILYTKETKKGLREINLKEGIYDISLQNGCFSMLINASSAGNIKPVQILSAFYAYCGMEVPENAFIIKRIDIFTNIGTEENMKLVSLGEIGFEQPED